MSTNKSALSGSIALAGDFEIDGLLIGTASWAIKAQTSSFFDGTSIEVADLRVTNTASIEYLNVVYQSSSVIYSSGSNIFGDSPEDTQTLHGTVLVQNDLQVTGSLNVNGGVIGNLTGNADTATSASHAVEADHTLNADAAVSASHALQSDNSVSASHALLADVASYVENAQSASYFFTSSVTSASRSEYSAFAENSAEALLANTASYVENAQSASYFLTSSVTSASFALSASHVVGAKDVGFSKEWHVSVGSGSDATGNGSLSKPFATLGKAFSVVGGTGEQIVVHPGLYLESTAVLTQPNVTICAANANAGGIAYMNGQVTIQGNTSSTRIVGILFNNLIHSGSAGLYLDKVQVKANYTKIGSGYSEIVNSDLQATGSVVFKGGTTVIQGDKVFAPVVSGSGTALYVKDVLSCVSPSAVAGGILAIDNSQIYPTVAGTAAVTSAAGTVVYLYNSQITTTTGVPERISIGGFLGYDDIQFNKSLSTLGTSLNTKAHFQSLDANLLTATGSLFGSASYALSSLNSISSSLAQSASWSRNSVSSSWSENSKNAQTASYIDSQNLVISNLTITNTASIAYLDVTYQSSSVIYSSGSNIFGDAIDDQQTLNGFVVVSGSQYISGGLEVIGDITGDLVGNASTATSASHALVADYVNNSPNLQAVLSQQGLAQISQSIYYYDEATGMSATLFDAANALAFNAGYSGIRAFGTSFIGDSTLHDSFGIDTSAVRATGGFTGSLQGNSDTATSASHALIADDLVNIPSLQAITTVGNSTSQSISIGVDIEMGSPGTPLVYTFNTAHQISSNPYKLRFAGIFGTPPDINFFVVGNKYSVTADDYTPDGIFTTVVQVTSIVTDMFGGYEVFCDYVSGEAAANGSITAISTFAAPAEYAFGQGQGVKVSANSQHVVGLWNSPVTGSGAFVVGNGSDDANRSNLIEASGNSVTFNGAINFLNLPSYSNDSEAEAGGVAIGGIYRNGNFIQIRIS